MINMKLIITIGILGMICLACMPLRSLPQTKKPVVYALDLEVLEKTKSRINSKDETILPAYKTLIKDAETALQFGPVSVMEKVHFPPSGNKHDYMSLAPYHWPDPNKPDGLPYIRKDGQTNPEVRDYKDKEYMPKLCDMVQTLGLAYYFSGEKRYAQHAANRLRVWFLDTATRMNPHLNYAQAIRGANTGRGAGLIDSRHFIKLVDGIGLLQGSSFWKEKDQQGMKEWFGAFLDWMQTSKIGKDEMDTENNYGAWYDAQRLALALFIGNNNLSKSIVASAKERLDAQMDDKGSFPKEMARTISLHYTVFVLEAFFLIAEMAEETGIDFWNYTSPSGKGLQKGFEAVRPLLVQEKEWQGQQIRQYDYEEGFNLLMKAGKEFKCKDCREAVRNMAGEKAGRLRQNLLY